MKIFLKNVKNVDENLGIINTKSESYRVNQIFIPDLGDIVEDKYKVIKRVWEKFGETLVIWVEDLKDETKIIISVYRRFPKRFTKSLNLEDFELLETKSIKESDLSLLPRVSDILEIGEERFEVKEIVRVGGLNTTKIHIITEKY